MDNSLDMLDIINQSFTQYAGAVIQSRALTDVRDCIKPSARQVYYSLFTDKFTHDKPFKKTLKAIGSAMRFYIHGDASCEGILMRSGQPFAMRYPLIEVEGSYGTLTETGNWAASRYTSSRLSAIANYLLQDTNTNTIEEWVDNYDDTEQYPRVLSSLGYYNIVNGSTGIAVGLASSIPQFNLQETNEALVKLLQNPDISSDELICYPDFATGATLINPKETIESLKAGKGKACILQATIEYDKKENALEVKDLPYGVYTNTICSEIEKLVNEDKNIGIININDLTGIDVCIKIYLDKNVDVDKIIHILYAGTSLQKSYSINMTMLQDGRFPKVYGWKEALQAHLNHEEQVYINYYNYRLKKLNHRLKIVEGILAAIAQIDKIVRTIKKAESTGAANKALQQLLNIDEEQAKAILDMKLSRLAHLESQKFEDEKQKLIKEIKQIQAILEDRDLLIQEMAKKFKEVSEKFGDDRRTKIEERIAAKTSGSGKERKLSIPEDVFISFTNAGYVKSVPVTVYRANAADINVFKTSTEDMVLLFSSLGKLYRIKVENIKQCDSKDKGVAAGALVDLEPGEKILNIFSMNIDEKHPYITGVTKFGQVKKSDKTIYLGSTQNKNGLKAAGLKEGDVFISFNETNGDYITLITNQKIGIQFELEKEVRASGKTARGVAGIKLNEGDYVIKVEINSVKNNKLPVQGRNGKGVKLA